MTLNYDIILYDKSVSKIDLVCNIADELKTAPNVSYLLCDSWYTCSKVTEAFIRKGFYTIGALKTNRIIFPSRVDISISKLAENILEEDKFFYPVTVKGHKYLVFRYECNLKDIDNDMVILLPCLFDDFSFLKGLSPQQARFVLGTKIQQQIFLSTFDDRLPVEKNQIGVRKIIISQILELIKAS